MLLATHSLAPCFLPACMVRGSVTGLHVSEGPQGGRNGLPSAILGNGMPPKSLQKCTMAPVELTGSLCVQAMAKSPSYPKGRGRKWQPSAG